MSRRSLFGSTILMRGGGGSVANRHDSLCNRLCGNGSLSVVMKPRENSLLLSRFWESPGRLAPFLQ